ncbi:hypothetical protein AX774_g6187 [Zancudomyces culisetae]|uniref:Uncharacterized protein n=1 Tax=Zancudomyces culisetae TaxID=1213189 RepID=A0A1R1PH99_ZANCU|nr:hypothetical protein AX774_g6187 [Zancudomyces culisetae]|eukprot:OMH80375.1 hypothetical protein AX774_g6187 [Zancudomyces culisetae]
METMGNAYEYKFLHEAEFIVGEDDPNTKETPNDTAAGKKGEGSKDGKGDSNKAEESAEDNEKDGKSNKDSSKSKENEGEEEQRQEEEEQEVYTLDDLISNALFVNGQLASGAIDYEVDKEPSRRVSVSKKIVESGGAKKTVPVQQDSEKQKSASVETETEEPNKKSNIASEDNNRDEEASKDVVEKNLEAANVENPGNNENKLMELFNSQNGNMENVELNKKSSANKSSDNVNAVESPSDNKKPQNTEKAEEKPRVVSTEPEQAQAAAGVEESIDRGNAVNHPLPRASEAMSFSNISKGMNATDTSQILFTDTEISLANLDDLSASYNRDHANSRAREKNRSQFSRIANVLAQSSHNIRRNIEDLEQHSARFRMKTKSFIMEPTRSFASLGVSGFNQSHSNMNANANTNSVHIVDLQDAINKNSSNNAKERLTTFQKLMEPFKSLQLPNTKTNKAKNTKKSTQDQTLFSAAPASFGKDIRNIMSDAEIAACTQDMAPSINEKTNQKNKNSDPSKKSIFDISKSFKLFGIKK